jgi:acetyltransferase-like isoleucine patch superfamily enzyme
LLRALISKVSIPLYGAFRRLFFRVLSSARIEGPVCFVQAAQIVGKGKLVANGKVMIGFFPSPHFFSSYCYLEARNSESKIEIGAGTHINNGFVAIAERSTIKIGKDCLVGTRVEMYDSDFHALSVNDRKQGKAHNTRNVTIGDHVFIGSNVRIFKGVSIGDGAVIANGAIVTKDVPAHTLYGGVPAKLIRRLD